MAILANSETRVIVQGITGKNGSFHAKLSLEYGTKIVGGVTPGKGGSFVDGIPVFNSCEEAVRKTGADASCIFVPAPFAADSIVEAADSGIKLIVVITEGIPAQDMLKAKYYIKNNYRDVKIIGPNCPGLLVPNECRIGIMPSYIFKRGGVGIVSRSGTLTYEVVWQITNEALGQSTCVGIGGDQIVGLGFTQILKMFEKDDETKAVVLIGEIGGNQEEEAAKFIRKMKKPVVAFIAGKTAPPGKRMGHAGAIIMSGSGTAEAKIETLKKAGAHIAESPADIGKKVKNILS